ncbi:cell division protein FtsA [Clostridium fermenticellae]|uniref:Cell division protein FtsA n=1 Tax=Clostridium fermenticellae TaxID=2068654 RepID=A0A386H3H8_9CLOT|nr:cell division protein FtsA [Clostridium fermenticellae]AYD40138.1 cell division protein FtsA [Clostridium fermenticellae]
MSEYIIGMDIGSSKICAAAGKVDKHGVMQIMGITSSVCRGVQRGIVVDIDATSEAIGKCINSLEGMIDAKISGVYISLPGIISELKLNKGVVAISSEDKEIKENDVRRVLKAAKVITIPSDKEIIGVIPQQYIIDGYDKIKDPVGMSGLRLEADVQLILAQSAVVNNIFKSINKSGLKVLGIVFEPIAMSEVILKREEIERGVAVVDVGADCINIYIFSGGKLVHIDSIPLGGNTITNDIAICLKLPFSEAENIKKKYGNVGEKHSNGDSNVEIISEYNSKIKVEFSILKQIIEARIEEILCMIGEKVSSSGHYDKLSGIVIVGGGLALIKDIEEFSQRILQKPVRVGIPNYIGASNPLYASVVGIVKDVADLVKNKKDVFGNEDSTEKKYDEWTKEKSKKSDKYENNTGFLLKIKEFFTDFF